MEYCFFSRTKPSAWALQESLSLMYSTSPASNSVLLLLIPLCFPLAAIKVLSLALLLYVLNAEVASVSGHHRLLVCLAYVQFHPQFSHILHHLRKMLVSEASLVRSPATMIHSRSCKPGHCSRSQTHPASSHHRHPFRRSFSVLYFYDRVYLLEVCSSLFSRSSCSRSDVFYPPIFSPLQFFR